MKKDWQKDFFEKFGNGRVIGPLEISGYIKSLLSEQEEAHKKELREVIKEAYGCALSRYDAQYGWDVRKKMISKLFKKYNCEEESDEAE